MRVDAAVSLEAVVSFGLYLRSETFAVQAGYSMLGDEQEVGLHNFICFRELSFPVRLPKMFEVHTVVGALRRSLGR